MRLPFVGPHPPHSLRRVVEPVRDGVDKRLVVGRISASCDRAGLTMRAPREPRRTNVGNPHLYWPQPRCAQPRTMGPHLFSRRLRPTPGRHVVTCNLAHRPSGRQLLRPGDSFEPLLARDARRPVDNDRDWRRRRLADWLQDEKPLTVRSDFILVLQRTQSELRVK